MKKLLLIIGIAFMGIKGFAQPAIYNLTATAITTTSCTISYDAGSNGSSTSVFLQYGTTPNSGNNNQIHTLSGSFSGTKTFTINGLLPNTLYFWKLSGNNTNGQTNASSTFTTLHNLNNTTNLIGKYRFSNGDLFTDESGNTNTLISSGALTLPTTDRSGATNSAAIFGGFGKIESTSSQFITGSISIAGWVFKTSSQAYSTIVGYRYNETFAPYNSYSLNSGTAATNKLNFSFTTTAANDLSLTSNATLNFNTWYHVAATYNAATGSAKLYINGVLDNSLTATPASIAYLTAASNNRFCIGALNYINNHAFVGTIDEIFVYGRAITATEVTDLYNSTYLSTQDFNTANLKASIYPNPAKDILNIEMENEVKSIEIYSLQGQKVLESTNKQINVSNLSKGLYMVRIEDDNKAVATKKLVIE